MPVNEVGTVATMLVSLQLVATPWVLLNQRALDPCVVPKFVPVIVTEAPNGPEDGFTPVILGEVACTTEIVADPDLVGSVAEVAVSVTALGLGAVAGDV